MCFFTKHDDLLTNKKNKLMKINKFIALFAYFITNILFSQSLQIEYERFSILDEGRIAHLTEDLQERIRESAKRKDIFVLSINGNESFYTLKGEHQQENKTHSGLGASVVRVNKIQKFDIYKNLQNNTLTIDTELFRTGKKYIISDQLPEIQWAITGETKQFGEYLLQKAIGKTYDNKEVIAWFSDKIEIPNGPHNYHGLPGLIMRLEDDNIVYMISKISYLDNIDIPQIDKNKKEDVSLEQFQAIKEKNALREGTTKEFDGNTTKTTTITILR